MSKTSQDLVADLRVAEAKREACRRERERIEILLAEARAHETYAEEEYARVVNQIDELP